MSSLHSPIRGTVWKFGDSIDTNQLAGGGLTGSSREESLRLNCLRALRPEFPEGVRPGDLLVAGTNFGNGSSRQRAVEALQACGIAAVLAESVGRIHLANSIALGLPTFAVPGIASFVGDHDVLEVSYGNSEVRNVTRNKRLSLPKYPPRAEAIFEAGGLLEMIARRLAEQGFSSLPV